MPDDPQVRHAIFRKYFNSEEWEAEFTQHTAELKRMARYADCSIFEIENLPLTLYLIIKKDSWIDSMQATEDGKAVLKDIWRLQQKHADIDKIRAKGAKQV
ncbi:hypothetical protein ACGCUP_00860 [Eubacteriales bacterium KG125]